MPLPNISPCTSKYKYADTKNMKITQLRNLLSCQSARYSFLLPFVTFHSLFIFFLSYGSYHVTVYLFNTVVPQICSLTFSDSPVFFSLPSYGFVNLKVQTDLDYIAYTNLYRSRFLIQSSIFFQVV